MSNRRTLLLVNFGGPRSKAEIPSFLRTLLTDQDVVRTRLPAFIHRWFFTRVAHCRAKKIAPDYDLIGGKSPIFEDTEKLAQMIEESSTMPVLTFHRYLPQTHANSLRAIERAAKDELFVFPLFPQFSYATTGSIARFFSKNLSSSTLRQMRWIKSYCAHRSYIQCMQRSVADLLKIDQMKEEETILLFSAHGVPQEFILTGDVYEKECLLSYEAISQGFPKAFCQLSYQSKFGRGKWLEPYTQDVCKSLEQWSKGRKNLVMIPLSFTSDHIETLFEMEHQYLPIVKEKGFVAKRCPALNLRSDWVDSIVKIAQESPLCSNHQLIFTKKCS